MTGSQFARYIRLLTKTSTATFSDSDIVLLANIVKDEIGKEIIKVDEDLFGVIMYANIKASDASDETSREYPLDNDILKIKRLEAKPNGTDWIRAKEFDPNLYNRTTNETEITSTFSNVAGEFVYDLYRGSLWLYSGTLTAITNGLRFFAITLPEDITTTDLSSSYNLSIPTSDDSSRLPVVFHELWARRISIIFKSGKEKPLELSELEKAYPGDFEAALDSITNPNLDRDMIMELPDDGSLQL